MYWFQNIFQHTDEERQQNNLGNILCIKFKFLSLFDSTLSFLIYTFQSSILYKF